MGKLFISNTTQALKVKPSEARAVENHLASCDFIDLLPFTLTLDGKPMDVKKARPMFSPLFTVNPIAPKQMFLCGRQVGKALDVDTPIPTPDGWTTMGKISIGDTVLDDSGVPTKVVFATDPMYDRICYEILFDDNSAIIADEEHLWEVSRSGRPSRIVTTKQLIKLQPTKKKNPRFSIRCSKPLDLPHKNLSIPPYLLGYWLGDGKSSDGRIFFGQQDYNESFETLNQVWGDWGKEYIDKNNVVTRCALGLSALLTKEGLIDNKMIPVDYLRASISQRLDLLRGLMDSDGTPRANGGCEITQKSKSLSQDIKSLLSSLGIKSKLNKKIVNGKVYWTVGFATQLDVFYLSRKKDLQRKRTLGHPKSTRHYIKSIKPIKSRPVKCIEVDSPSHLFLAGESMIPTHNTAGAAGYVCMNCVWRMGFRIAYVVPLALYCNRFHHMYMAKMLRNCKLPWPVMDKTCVNNNTEKTFVTGSHFHGISCFNSAGNAIGLTADVVVYDEVQDLNFDFIPQIREVLGTSNFRYELFFGTARGVENTIQKVFNETSQSEFSIRCHACNYWNIPSDDQDALAMIQKHGIACAKCERLLDVEDGQWVHAYPDRVDSFVGWHVPQTVVKARITPHDKYLDTIYDKLYGIRRYSMAKFKNEILGISVETGSTPITPQQIRNASILNKDKISVRDYTILGGGTDWGGAEQVSFTVGTIVGFHRTGRFHCINAIRPTGIPENERHLPIAKFFIDHLKQQDQIFAIFADGAFVGSVQNKNLQAVSGISVGSCHYGTIKKFFTAKPGNVFIVDRTTLIYIVYTLIKEGKLLFPEGEEFEIFTNDLKSVYIEETDTPRGQVQKYVRRSSEADDFLHALGYAVLACAIGQGIDLPTMVGLEPGTSATKDYIDTIGEEMPITTEFM